MEMTITPSDSGSAVLQVDHLDVDYPTATGRVAAVRDVSLAVYPGQIIGIAGESGCGKSTLAHAICGLLRPPAHVVGGRVDLGGRNLVGLSETDLRQIRWKEVAIVPQSAMNNLSPVLRVGDQIADAITTHESVRLRDARARARALLERVGIPGHHVASYPHELSGGMRQRAVIAMALALNPRLLVLDEPTTALDVMVQASILSEIRSLREELGFAVIFITHDLPLLIQTADRIAVMYGGRLVETGDAKRLWEAPQHPYTAALLSAFPPLTGPRVRLPAIPGSPPDLRDPPQGCAFADRCPKVMARCRADRPVLEPSPSGEVACWVSGTGGNGHVGA